MSSTKKNYIYQVFYQLLISILPFITSPYISRVLGAENIGIYTYTFSIITYFKIFASLGITNYGNRTIAQVRENQSILNKTFSSLFSLHAILSLIVIAAYLVYWSLFIKNYKIIALIQAFYLVGELFDINWFFFGIEKFKLTVTRNSLLKILTAILIFLFVKDKKDLWIYVLILSLGTCISSSAVWIFVPKYVRFVAFSIKDMLKHIKPLMVLFFAVIAVSVFSYMDKIMIGALSSYSELGFYENAWKMIEFPTGFVTALGTVMLPKISNLLIVGDKKQVNHYMQEAMRFSMFFSIAIAFGVAGIAKEFSVVFWGEEFATSGILMMLLSVTIILMSFSSVIRTQYLIPLEYDKVYLLAVWGGAAINFIANYLLIPKFGSVGATFGTVMAYFAIFLIQNIFAAKDLPITDFIKPNIPYFFIGGLMFFSVRLVGWRMGNTIESIMFEVMVGIIVYATFSFLYAIIFKDDFIIKYIKIGIRFLRNLRGKG